MKVRFAIILSLLFIFNACVDESQIEPELQKYVDRFQAEAAKRGHNFDFDALGVIVEFADLEDGVAGLCHYSTPRKIQIDRSYYNEVGGYRNSDLMREDVMFHELAHGFLNRDHDNRSLPNGDWKTMMCGDKLPDNRSSNINYRKMRRKYYIDELFNSETPAPWWATANPDFSRISYFMHEEEHFLNSDTNWAEGNFNNTVRLIADGNYSITTKSTPTYICLPTDVNILSDFYFEVRLKIVSGNKDKQGGIIFGNLDSRDINHFSVNNAGRMYPYNTQNYTYFIELLKSDIKENDFNELAVRKAEQYLYYYINGKIAYIDEIDNEKAGYDFGLIIDSNITLLVDYFKVSSIFEPALRSTSKSRNIVEVEAPEQKIVRRR